MTNARIQLYWVYKLYISVSIPTVISVHYYIRIILTFENYCDADYIKCASEIRSV